LILPSNLKKFIDKIFKTPSNKIALSFAHFEGLLKDICFSSFLSSAPSDRAYLFFSHINEACKQSYKVDFILGPKRRTISTELSIKNNEDINSSVDLDLTIKEALETLKTKDESFRSSNGAFSREASPVPSIKSGSGLKSSDVRLMSSASTHYKRPYCNQSVPHSPNSSILADRPNSRYKIKINLKDDELDEFLKTEKMVESEATVKVTLQQTSSMKSLPNFELKNLKQIVSPRLYSSASKKNVVKGSLKSNMNASNNPKIILNNTQSVVSNKMRYINSDLIEKHREYIIKDQTKLFSSTFVLGLIFSSWKSEWEKSRRMKS
jgi:hypothetical protein